MTHRLLLIIIFSIFSTTLFAQTGSIQGIIKDSVSQEPVIGAYAIIEGTTIGSATDVEGRFTINVAPGNHTVVISFVSYQTRKFANIKVEAGKVTPLDVMLPEATTTLSDFVVTATKQTNSVSAVLVETRKAQQIVSGISSEQIVRSLDRDASEVVKRVPGVTIMDNRFVMVRGLGERYNAVLLNNALTPSSEADKKAFSFDLIPSGMIDRIMIYKSGAPELPGEFAGGAIKIFTKSMPTENAFSINASVSSRANTTFNNFYNDTHSSTDFLGFGATSRMLPSSFPATLNGLDGNALTSAGQSLPNNWAASKNTAMPDMRLALNFARVMEIGGKKVGNITSLSYTNTRQFYQAARYNYNEYDNSAERSDTIFKYRDNQYDISSRLGLISNWTLQFNNNNRIEFRNLFNQSGLSQVTQRSGINFEAGQELKSTGLRYESRSLYSGQLQGVHTLGGDRTSVNWTVGFSASSKNEPDFRRVTQQRAIDAASDEPYETIIPPGASTFDAGRFFSKLNEKVSMASGQWEYKLNDKEDKAPVVRAGFYAEQKNRNFDARWMSFIAANSGDFNQNLLRQPLNTIFSATNINATTGFKLAEGTNPSDSYTASNTLAAAYAGTTLPFADKFTFSGGVRVEYNRQQLSSRTYGGSSVKVDNPVVSVLPSANLSYNLTEKQLVRIAYCRTINRPEFRELAPFTYYDFITNTVYKGNSDVKTATIDNVDLRYEWYPSPSESVSLGVFYKNFKNPVESYFVASTGGGTRNFTYENAASATSIGAELEVRKSLQDLSNIKFIQNLTVVANASVIKNRVDLGNKAVGQATERPMMGQSPYIVNAGLYYDNRDANLQVNLLYNVIGQRLYAVGNTYMPNLYEMPRNVIDLSVNKSIGSHLEIKFGIQDLLNQRVNFKQDSNGDDKINGKDENVINFKRGSYTTFGITYKF